jgi:predicted nucleic acid-binding protein
MSTFVDTSFLLAAARKKDIHHQQAVAWQKLIRGNLLTTEYVLVEFLNSLAAPETREVANHTVKLLRERNVIKVVSASKELFDEGLQWYSRYRDKAWSMTDCISFVLMSREGIQDALTADRDFEQAGFRALLRSDPP